MSVLTGGNVSALTDGKRSGSAGHTRDMTLFYFNIELYVLGLMAFHISVYIGGP